MQIRIECLPSAVLEAMKRSRLAGNTHLYMATANKKPTKFSWEMGNCTRHTKRTQTHERIFATVFNTQPIKKTIYINQ